ncbi:hypothetical protein [Pseudoxanthomonas winnipegensis]|jgi:hypothetical protein|uniref:Uncharacterized protein n=1 Tax=Pseudoxanthomonas winnipegensis TaxID=2480810 RepID=A0A4Q8LA54_9GAMM|nr:hypothetical protein [Pseudoxanthomonas winnipegensis]TAA25493.1 hypothetical protein EA660_08535 [Pseudoxanthomonas winnipegensis]
MAWQKVDHYSFGFKPADKTYWMYYTLVGSRVSTQVFLSATECQTLATLFNASASISYESVGGYFATEARQF